MINSKSLIYDYTKELANSTNEGIYRSSTKLAAIVSFNGLLIKFATELDSCYLSLTLTKVICVCLLLGSLVCCILGIKSKASGHIINEKDLVDNYWDEDTEITQKFIISEWSKGIDELVERYSEKKKYTNISLALTVWSLMFFGLNAILATFYSCQLTHPIP